MGVATFFCVPMCVTDIIWTAPQWDRTTQKKSKPDTKQFPASCVGNIYVIYVQCKIGAYYIYLFYRWHEFRPLKAPSPHSWAPVTLSTSACKQRGQTVHNFLETLPTDRWRLDTEACGTEYPFWCTDFPQALPCAKLGLEKFESFETFFCSTWVCSLRPKFPANARCFGHYSLHWLLIIIPYQFRVFLYRLDFFISKPLPVKIILKYGDLSCAVCFLFSSTIGNPRFVCSVYLARHILFVRRVNLYFHH